MPVPGLSQPVQLGLAGGPLIVGLIIGRYGRIGPIVASMPASVNHAFREYGIGVFFAAVGLAAGPADVRRAVFSGNGVRWLGASAIITTVPLLIGGFIGRLVMKMNFAALGGLLAGSVTVSPRAHVCHHDGAFRCADGGLRYRLPGASCCSPPTAEILVLALVGRAIGDAMPSSLRRTDRTYLRFVSPRARQPGVGDAGRWSALLHHHPPGRAEPSIDGRLLLLLRRIRPPSRACRSTTRRARRWCSAWTWRPCGLASPSR